MGWAIGLAPVVLRAATEGVLAQAAFGAVATAAALWLAPSRWKGVAGVATASVVGVIVLELALGMAMGVFVAAGVVVTGRPGGEPIAREARVLAALGLTLGAAGLVLSPRVAIPTGLTAGAVVGALGVQLFRPTWLQRLVAAAADAMARRSGPTAATVRTRIDAVADRLRTRTAPPVGWLLAVCALAAAGGALLGIRDQRLVLIDDAAITFRYAARIAAGDGFTYNDGDRTNGASAPLYTLLLALGHLLGRDLDTLARSLGVACYAASAALVTAIVGRARGVMAGAVGGFVLLTSSSFRAEALNGMESVVAALLGMLVILLVMEGHLTWGGVVLGLAIVNKVDAGFLALAVGTSWLLVQRRPPWRLATVAALTAAPWFIFSQLYFGSVLPYSATQKIGGEVTNATYAHDPLWILRRISWDQGLLLLGGLTLALLLVLGKVKLETRPSLAVVSCGLWVVLHGTAFSLVDLGDPYPWYTTVLFPPLISGGVLAVFIAAERMAAAVPSHRFSDVSLTTLTRGLTGGLVLLLLISLESGISSAGRVVREGHEITHYEQFEETRRLAGQYVGRRAEPDEVVQSCYGWAAFGALENPFKETCPLSTRIDPGPPTWIVESYQPDERRSVPPSGIELVTRFRSPHGETFVYRVG